MIFFAPVLRYRSSRIKMHMQMYARDGDLTTLDCPSFSGANVRLLGLSLNGEFTVLTSFSQ